MAALTDKTTSRGQAFLLLRTIINSIQVCQFHLSRTGRGSHNSSCPSCTRQWIPSQAGVARGLVVLSGVAKTTRMYRCTPRVWQWCVRQSVAMTREIQVPFSGNHLLQLMAIQDSTKPWIPDRAGVLWDMKTFQCVPPLYMSLSSQALRRHHTDITQTRLHQWSCSHQQINSFSAHVAKYLPKAEEETMTQKAQPLPCLPLWGARAVPWEGVKEEHQKRCLPYTRRHKEKQDNNVMT